VAGPLTASERSSHWLKDNVVSTFLILSVAKVFDIFARPETVTSACAFITDVYNSFPTLSSSTIMHALGEAAWAAKKYQALGGWVEMKAF
jgi:hypothetical protein